MVDEDASSHTAVDTANETANGTATDLSNAWQPGLESSIPGSLLPLVTLYRPENAFRSYAECRELSDLTGLKTLEMVSLRPERLVTHELLLRVSADLSVSDGPSYEVLGINLRAMVSTVYERYVVPQMPAIVEAFNADRDTAKRFIEQELDKQLFDRPPADQSKPAPSPWWSRWWRRSETKEATPAEREPLETVALRYWEAAMADTDTDTDTDTGADTGTGTGSDTDWQRQCLRSLIHTIGSVIRHRGRLVADRDVLANVVLSQVCNAMGAERISRLVDPLFLAAIEGEGYDVLPIQQQPVVMNVKGASASGKSTIRPRQRELAEKLGIPWADFALISPDYWRKYLVDYTSLGDDYKYGAMLSGEELAIIDKKLDRYMAAKARRGEMSHLLIDRFRFDSFTLESRRPVDSQLLTRFGHRIYLFFMITPPAETVERAWLRGLTTGRYKAVDDLLFHNIEAFTGMPALFLSWINAEDKHVHVEFLDNSVAKGELARTAALAANNTLTILDLELMLDIDRFRKVNVDAQCAAEVLQATEMAPVSNLGFVKACVEKIADVRLAHHDTGEIYGWIRTGKLVWWDESFVAHCKPESGVIAVLQAFGFKPGSAPDIERHDVPEMAIAEEKKVTVGQWGPA